MARSVRGVLFDLDDTLIDRDDAFRGWSDAYVSETLRLQSPEEQAEARQLLWQLDARGRGSKSEMHARLRTTYSHVEENCNQFIRQFRQSLLGHLRLRPDAIPTLQLLRERGLPIGIVTNGSASQLEKVSALSLDKLVARVVVSAIANCSKPDRAIFLLAARLIERPPDDILFVGDDPEKDIFGASQANMQTAWLRCGRNWPAELAETLPSYTINDLHDIASIVGTDDHVNYDDSIWRESNSPIYRPLPRELKECDESC